MAINIITEPDVHVTAGDLARYTEEYEKDYSMHCGPKPTLEEYIRRREKQAADHTTSLMIDILNRYI